MSTLSSTRITAAVFLCIHSLVYFSRISSFYEALKLLILNLFWLFVFFVFTHKKAIINYFIHQPVCFFFLLFKRKIGSKPVRDKEHVCFSILTNTFHLFLKSQDFFHLLPNCFLKASINTLIENDPWFWTIDILVFLLSKLSARKQIILSYHLHNLFHSSNNTSFFNDWLMMTNRRHDKEKNLTGTVKDKFSRHDICRLTQNFLSNSVNSHWSA